MKVSAERILIVLLGAIGDVTLALPLLARLRQGYPRARITWAVEPAAAPLLQDHPGLDDVLLFDRARGAAAFVRILRQVRELRPDLTLDLQRHLKSGVISRASGAAVRLGFHRRNSREGNWLFNTHSLQPMAYFSPKLRQFLRFGDWLEIEPVPVSFGLRLNAAEECRVDELVSAVQSPFVVAFVGASWESKGWFAESTAAVIDTLGSRGVGAVLVGGKGDQGVAAAVVRQARVAVCNLAGQVTLRDLIGVFRRAGAAFGADTGPMHIAAAAGTHVVSLWGATDPARSAPWNNTEGVLAGIAPCSPCYLRRCPIGRLCMESITPAAVAEKLLAHVEARI